MTLPWGNRLRWHLGNNCTSAADAITVDVIDTIGAGTGAADCSWNVRSCDGRWNNRCCSRNAANAISIRIVDSTGANTQTARNPTLSNNIKSEEIHNGAVGGGAVNVNALSTGLSSGPDTKAGSLNGFAS